MQQQVQGAGKQAQRKFVWLLRRRAKATQTVDQVAPLTIGSPSPQASTGQSPVDQQQCNHCGRATGSATVGVTVRVRDKFAKMSAHETQWHIPCVAREEVQWQAELVEPELQVD